MIELPELAPFDALADDAAEQMHPAAMLGRFGELDSEGYPYWESHPESLGTGLTAMIRAIRPLASVTPKIEGEVFLERLRGFGIDTSDIQLSPDAIRQDPSLHDEGRE